MELIEEMSIIKIIKKLWVAILSVKNDLDSLRLSCFELERVTAQWTLSHRQGVSDDLKFLESLLCDA